jgi:hypothetical protein
MPETSQSGSVVVERSIYSGEFIDIVRLVGPPHFSLWRLLWMSLIGCAIVAPIMWLAFYDEKAARTLCVVLMLVGAAIGTVWVFVGKIIRERRLVAKVALDGLNGVIDSARDLRPEFGATPCSDLTCELIQRGIRNVTIRLSARRRNQTVQPLDPITVNFAPCPLDDADSSFQELSHATRDINSAQPDASRRDKIASPNQRFQQRIGLAIGSLFLIGIALLDVWNRGTLARPALLIMVFALAFLFFPIGRPKAHKWYLVPGGLLRRSPSDKARSDLHIFSRKNSVMILRPSDMKSVAYISDLSSSATIRNMTYEEAKMLLRAWLSPLDPPPVESLVDYQ